MPAGLGALGGIAVGEVVAFGLLGYSPFGVGVAGYVPLTSLTLSRYMHGAYVYMAAMLGAKAALGLYGSEPTEEAGGEAPAAAATPVQAAPAAPPLPGEHGS